MNPQKPPISAVVPNSSLEPSDQDRRVDAVAKVFRWVLFCLIVLLILLLVVFFLYRGSGYGSVGESGSGQPGQGHESGGRQGQGSAAGTVTGTGEGADKQSNKKAPQGPEEQAVGSENPTQVDAEDGTNATEQQEEEPAGIDPDSVEGDEATQQDEEAVIGPTFLRSIPSPSADEVSGGSGGAPGGGSGPRSAGEFFGVKSKGAKCVYVVDCSGSMMGGPFTAASNELVESIRSLRPNQKFYVIFFSDQSFPMFYPNESTFGGGRGYARGQNTDRSARLPREVASDMLTASKAHKQKCVDWIKSFSRSGGTDPASSLLHALSLKPDVIFLLSDGQFSAQVPDIIRSHNEQGTVINTIAFINRSGEPLLKLIAEENDGEYRFVP